MTPGYWILVSLPPLIWGVGAWASRRTRAKKGLILSLLEERGELTGMQLRDAGVGALVYNYLYELEKEGFVFRRDDGLPHPERGGHPLSYYSLASRQVARAKPACGGRELLS